MRQIKDVLRLTLELHHSQRHIAASLGLSKGVVAKYIKLASDAGLHWPQIEVMSETWHVSLRSGEVSCIRTPVFWAVIPLTVILAQP